MGAWKRLARWAGEDNEISAAVLGAGYVGLGVVHQFAQTPGIRPAVVVNRTVDRALQALELAGYDRGGILVSDDPGQLAQAVGDGRPAATPAAGVLAELAGVNVVIEATGALAHGARTMMDVLEAGIHVVSFNAEVDALLGYLLHDVASRHGAVYTIADGDQPGVLLRQLELVEGMGFETVAAVNCKRNLDVHQNPDDSRGFATRDGTSVLMTTAFGDGTKMQVENVVVANVTGLVPDRRGMHGVRTTLEHCVRDITSVISRRGVVEYTLGGDFGAGVLVIGHADDPEMVQPYMRFLKMGDGPDYLFFRPYHLVHLEVPATVAEVVLDHQPLGTPPGPPAAEVVAVAKRDLAAGEWLDGIGGFTCYGHADLADDAKDLLPVGLAEHARVVQPVGIDEPIPLSAVELDEDAELVRLRRRQETLVAEQAPAAALSR